MRFEKDSFIPRFVLAACVALTFVACKPVPTEPESFDGVIDRTYTNEEWGFSITVPQDSSWSLSAGQFLGGQEPNGLTPVDVVLRRSNPGQVWRPTMLLSSFGLANGTDLNDSVAAFESLYGQEFANYNTFGQKRDGTVGGEPSIEWFFQAREPQSGFHIFNNRYLSVIFVRGDQLYRIVCSAQQDDFPEAEFRSILATFEFFAR